MYQRRLTRWPVRRYLGVVAAGRVLSAWCSEPAAGCVVSRGGRNVGSQATLLDFLHSVVRVPLRVRGHLPDQGPPVLHHDHMGLAARVLGHYVRQTG